METLNQILLVPTANHQKVILNLPHNPKVIGRIHGGTFVSVPKDERIHIMRKYRTIGINAEVLNLPNVSWIQIPLKRLDGTMSILETSSDYFRRFGTHDTFGGYEEQVFLKLSAFGRERTTRVDKQLGLFDGEAVP